jgi:hypothetical protein
MAGGGAELPELRVRVDGSIVLAVQIPGGGVKLYALLGAALVVAVALGLLITALATGHDPTHPPYSDWLRTSIEIVVALLGFAGLGGAVQNVHLAVNSRLDQLVATTASDSRQQGAAEAVAAIAASTNPATPPAAP